MKAYSSWDGQQTRNAQLLAQSTYMRPEITTVCPPFSLDLSQAQLSAQQISLLQALEIKAARLAIQAVASLSKLNEVDHMGGGLDLLPALLLTLSQTDYEKVEFTIENAHTSAGYFAALAALGFISESAFIDHFRRGLDIPGHVAWLPGGTQLNGGRLGIMIPTAVGQALGKKARYGADAWVLCHCGDAGWISGQALNGFNAAHFHQAPVTFIMHRNGIQLSGTNRQIMDKDPRPIIAALGVEILEIPCLFDAAQLFLAYREARALAAKGRPSLIYPAGFASNAHSKITLAWVAQQLGIADTMQTFAQKHKVALDREVWVPGSLMSYRDVECMLECLFFVNQLPGGKGHHDGHMKGRNLEQVLANPMLQLSSVQQAALANWQAQAPRTVATRARPASGTANLVLPADKLTSVKLPGPEGWVSPRNGSQLAYECVAKAFPQQLYLVDCDLAPSTKIDKARAAIPANHQFEMSIEEQVSACMANGLAMATRDPQLVVFATFAAFFEGIAREGFEMWRYQRNLTGSNEGLNVTFHLSHVGSCTGRDHFSGWSLDWINLALGYLPYLHRFYTPADARAAFVAVKDLAAHYGAHIIGIPRDNLPILCRQGTQTPLWEATSAWEDVTPLRQNSQARQAILAVGATAFVAADACDQLLARQISTDVFVVNGLPLQPARLPELLARYPGGLVTVEDGLIGDPASGVRGFAGLVRSAAADAGVPVRHIGISDPRIAPADGHLELWKYFGITAEEVAAAVQTL